MAAAFRIRSVEIPSPWVLAPMAGYTHLPFRRLCRRFEAGLVYTEMVSVEGLVRKIPASWHLLRVDPGEHPIAAHLYGHSPDTFARAAALVEETGRFDIIDINAGCPVPKIAARGAGAGLLKDPARLLAVVRAVKSAVHLPVTVKTRIGWSGADIDMMDLVRRLEDAGVDAVALHARSVVARHAGPAAWEALAQVKQAVRITIIGNGGVLTPEDAVRRLRAFGVDGVMIARGALGRPWIFAAAQAAWEGREWRSPTLHERKALALEHLRELVALAEEELAWRRRARFHPEQAAVSRFRGHLCHYFAGMPGVVELRRKLNGLHTVADVEAALACIREPGE